ncbi:MAG: competence protein TfoX [Clostridia bacterium]|nr:competence protein TfoX [Clostridia bacterium]
MASTKEYLGFVLSQINGIDITYKKMMDEYLLYANGVLLGGIYDDRLLIKPIEKAKGLLPNAEYAIPYDGAKPMIFCDFVDDGERLTNVIENLSCYMKKSINK